MKMLSARKIKANPVEKKDMVSPVPHGNLETHLRRLEGVVGRKVDVKEKDAALVGAVARTWRDERKDRGGDVRQERKRAAWEIEKCQLGHSQNPGGGGRHGKREGELSHKPTTMQHTHTNDGGLPVEEVLAHRPC